MKSHPTVQLCPATLDDKPIIQRLLEFCLYDASETDGSDLNSHGCFGYPYLDHYWVETGRHPFLVRVENDKLAGFVLVNQHVHVTGSERAIAEFFILRKYRRCSIGRAVAFQVFDRFPGRWEVQQTATNLTAQAFWRKIIAEYTVGQFSEITLQDERWQGPIQLFDNTEQSSNIL